MLQKVAFFLEEAFPAGVLGIRFVSDILSDLYPPDGQTLPVTLFLQQPVAKVVSVCNRYNLPGQEENKRCHYRQSDTGNGTYRRRSIQIYRDCDVLLLPGSFQEW